MNLEGPSFVSGGRQLGKSALLWSAKETFDNGADRRAVMTEIRLVGSRRRPRAGVAAAGGRARRRRHRRPPRRVPARRPARRCRPRSSAGSTRTPSAGCWSCSTRPTCSSTPTRPATVRQHRRVQARSWTSTHRRVKFVFAGLHRIARFESLPNQPLAHLGKPVIVGPLRPQAAYDLLTRPLNALGLPVRRRPHRTRPGPGVHQQRARPAAAVRAGADRAPDRRATSATVRRTLITDDDITAVLEDTDLAEPVPRQVPAHAAPGPPLHGHRLRGRVRRARPRRPTSA